MHVGLPDLSMPSEEQVHLAAESFRMLGDPTRIKILWALLHGESSVSCLADLVGASTTTVSQHLAKLRLAGLVRGRREGTFIYYAAADTHVRALLAEGLFHADHADRELGDDREHEHEVGSFPDGSLPARPPRANSAVAVEAIGSSRAVRAQESGRGGRRSTSTRRQRALGPGELIVGGLE